MDQSKQLGADQAQLVEAIGQATEYIMQGVGQMHPAFAVAGLIGAIELEPIAGSPTKLVTATGMLIGELLGGALVIETIFAWPGVGRFAVSAVLNRDFPVMQCFTLLLTTLLVLCNLVVDICYAWLDPRTRLAGVMA